MKSRAIYIVLPALVISLIIAACGDKDKNPTGSQNSIPSELLGVWIYQSATINGVPISLALILGWEVGTVSARFTVGEDGSFVNEELNANNEVVWTENGTLAVTGDSAIIAVTSNNNGPIDPPDTLAGTWQLNGNLLALTTIYNQATVVLTAGR